MKVAEIARSTGSSGETRGGPDVETLCTHIACEYLEMPNLALTLPQAIRLWHTDAECCTRALDRLVANGFLRRVGDRYQRNDAAYRAA